MVVVVGPEENLEAFPVIAMFVYRRNSVDSVVCKYNIVV